MLALFGWTSGGNALFELRATPSLQPAALGSLPAAAWGIDACLTCFVPIDALPEWLELLKTSDVRWLRERGVWGQGNALSADTHARMKAERDAGFHVVAFAGTPESVRPESPGNQLPEDLQAVYACGFQQGRECADVVDAWELSGEPDVGYCRDLPDRLAAYNKAMYLGLKAGAASVQPSLREKIKFKDEHRAGEPETDLKLFPSTHDVGIPIVLMGALALPAGPWLERASRNGILDYTDAYNFHYYGNPDELTGHILAQRHASRDLQSWGWPKPVMRHGRPADRWSLSAGFRPCVSRPRALPLWVTECGLGAVAPDDFLNSERRGLQAEFTVATSKQALAARDVAVFMPFILVHKDDPHAMVMADDVAPLPAWDAYAKFTRENPWPLRKLFNQAGEGANPVVLQWLPEVGTLSHKVAGTYRVNGPELVGGEFRVYNFSDREVSGELEVPETVNLKVGVGLGLVSSGVSGAASHKVSPYGKLTIPAGGMVSVPASYRPRMAEGYFREWTTVRFRDECRRVSQVFFGLERRAQERDFAMQPVKVQRLVGTSRLQSPLVNIEGLPMGPWRVFNGLIANVLITAKNTESVPTQDTGAGWRFSAGNPSNDPLAPTYALAALQGVPDGARFLRLHLDRPMDRNGLVRADLVDSDGQRFTIWENFGNVYGERSQDVWLGLSDFHPHLWGKAVPGHRTLQPEKVREIMLRFYFPKGGSLDVEMDWALIRH